MTNPQAERVKKVSQLTGRSAVRARRGQFLAEGPQSVREALRAHLGLLNSAAQNFWLAGQVIDQLYWVPGLADQDPELWCLVEQAMEAGGIFGSAANQQVLDAMGDAVVAQEIIAVCAIPEYSPELATDKPRLIAGLCRIQDPGNVGTIIRVADAAGVDRVYLTEGSADIYNPKVVRSTAGSLFHLPVLPGLSLDELVAVSRDAGHQILAADGYGDLSLPAADQVLGKPATWLLGNEAQGLNETELTASDHRIAIPLYGQAESLNVATAATVCLYASAIQQRHDTGSAS